MHRIFLFILFWQFSTAVLADWPHWRGAERNDVVAESSQFEVGGWPPKEIAWTASTGEGSASPIIVGSTLYAFGWASGRDRLTAYDTNSGKQQWRVTWPAPRYGRKALGDQGLYSGPSSTPEYDYETGYLFTLGADGDLHCLDTAQKGREVWGFNLYDRYDMEQRPRVNRSGRRDYGYTSSPLVYRDWLIAEVGATEATLIAFDKKTGREVWKSKSGGCAGHNGGPVLLEVEGVPCAAVHRFEGLLVVRLDDQHAGETVAEYSWKTDFANNIATLAVHKNNIVITSSYNIHKIARLKITLSGIEKMWERDEASKVCSPIIHKGRIYWAWRKLYCLDFETGKVNWSGGGFGDPGSCIVTADDRIIVWSGEGDLTLIESAERSPESYKPLAARRRLGKSDAWPHVVLDGKKLYCRDRTGQLICLRLGG